MKPLNYTLAFPIVLFSCKEAAKETAPAAIVRQQEIAVAKPMTPPKNKPDVKKAAPPQQKTAPEDSSVVTFVRSYFPQFNDVKATIEKHAGNLTVTMNKMIDGINYVSNSTGPDLNGDGDLQTLEAREGYIECGAQVTVVQYDAKNKKAQVLMSDGQQLLPPKNVVHYLEAVREAALLQKQSAGNLAQKTPAP